MLTTFACLASVGLATGCGKTSSTVENDLRDPDPSDSPLPPPISPPLSPDGGEEEVGWVRLHNSAEYAATMEDLLGVPVDVSRLSPDERGPSGFDNDSSVVRMTPVRFDRLFDVAVDAAREAFGDPQVRYGIVSCFSQDSACAATMIREFGERAFRRPVGEEQVATFVDVYDETRALGHVHYEALQFVVVAILMSADFLHRVEFAPPVDPETLHPLTSFEVAQRLSYFLWGTMPDEELFELARQERLTDSSVVRNQASRMLQDERASTLVSRFGTQWFRFDEVESRTLPPAPGPAGGDLRPLMLAEARDYFRRLLEEGVPISQLLLGAESLINHELGSHYGVPSPPVDWQLRPMYPEERRGVLGLGAFLTASSFDDRTSPSRRGTRMLEAFLCQNLPPHPVEGGSIGPEPDPEATPRETLEAFTDDPACSACHDSIDPLGFVLERFEQGGLHRTRYEGGKTVDTAAQLADGAEVDDLPALAEHLASHERFLPCVVDRTLSYAFGRPMKDQDEATITSLLSAWRDDPTLRALILAIVESPAFLTRRGDEPE